MNSEADAESIKRMHKIFEEDFGKLVDAYDNMVEDLKSKNAPEPEMASLVLLSFVYVGKKEFKKEDELKKVVDDLRFKIDEYKKNNEKIH